MVYHYRTRGVCSQEMRIELNDDHTIKGVAIIGGCNGNLQGISRLVEGMKAEDAPDIAVPPSTTAAMPNRATANQKLNSPK